jgi:putative ABC transport system permease protein
VVTVFSIIHAVLIRPLPYEHPSHLVDVSESATPNDVVNRDPLSPGDFTDWQQSNRVFTSIAAGCGFSYNLTGIGEPEHLYGYAISYNYFSTLGIRPTLGRDFLPSDDSFYSPRVVVLSNQLWTGKFHADSNIVGRAISLNGDPFTVIGVMPADFSFPYDPWVRVWVPLRQQVRPDRMLVRDSRYLGVVARLRSGVGLDAARADMNRIAEFLHKENPQSLRGAVVMPLQEALFGDLRPTLTAALAIVACVLLIGSANVAILMLARVSGRAGEMAIRMALGAGSWRVLQTVFEESVILAFCSGGLAIVWAVAARALLLRFEPQHTSLSLVKINWPVCIFAMALSIAVGFGFGILPGLHALRTDIQQVLRRAGNAATTDVHGRSWRNALITAEVALSVVLLIGSGLLLRSMLRLADQPLGFRTDHVLAAWVKLPRIKYQNNTDVAAFFTQLQQRLRAIPGLGSVGLGYRAPLQGVMWTGFTLPGKQYAPGEYESAALRFVDSGFIPTLEVPLLEGRNLDDADDANAEPVAVVSQALARKYWPQDAAVGKYINTLRDGPVTRRVVGVVRDIRSDIDTVPTPTLYVSFKQMSFPSMTVVMQTTEDAGSALRHVRAAVQSVDPEQPLEDVESMDSIVRDSLEPWRFALWLLSGLSGMAVILTILGLFAVMSYLVKERTKEIGIRVTLGAKRSHIVRLILEQTVRVAFLGTAIGVSISIAMRSVLAGTGYAIQPNDPVTFVAVALLLTALSIASCIVPARRAAGLDPMVALREE